MWLETHRSSTGERPLSGGSLQEANSEQPHWVGSSRPNLSGESPVSILLATFTLTLLPSRVLPLRARIALAFSAAMLRPLSHKLAPLVEQVAAAVGRFDFVTDGVGERHFSHLAWKVGGFRAPVPEG